MIAIVSLFTIAAFMLDVGGIYPLYDSTASNGAKLGWTVCIIALPILGFIFWYAAGPKPQAQLLRLNLFPDTEFSVFFDDFEYLSEGAAL